MRPRVLFLDHTGALGGAELCLLDIAGHFRETSAVALMADGPFRQKLESHGVKTLLLESAASLHQVKRGSRIPSAGAAAAVVQSARAVAQLSRGYDIVYANSQKAFVVGGLAAMFLRRPLIWHLHDILDPQVFSRLNIGVDVFLANRLAARVIANSRATAGALRACGGRRATIDIVYNGLDPAVADAVSDEDATAARRALGIGDATVIGVFGRLAPWKGQDVAIRALALLDVRPLAHLVIVGDALFGEEAYAARLRALVDETGLRDRVHFLGFRSDVATLMRAVDILVHTSTSPEPFGRVIAEGMLAERPIVATAGGGASEIVSPGVTAWQVRPNNPEELAAALREVIDDPLRARAVAKAGRNSALERFTLAVTLPLIERSIDQAVSA
jgi:glycosyltransferase involved in cell wall biosynthesis